VFLKSSAIFSFLTFVSRIFGFIRDILIASFFGTGLFADALNVALRLPNLFRNIFAEGALSAAFVPLFSSKLEVGGKKLALKFAGNIFSILIISLLLLILSLEIFMPTVIAGLAPGFKSYSIEKFNITTSLSYITTPYLFFISLSVFFSCILNSIGKFAAMAATPIILNFSMIVGILCFGETQIEKTYAAAWSVTIGGMLQLLFIIFFVIRQNLFPPITKPKITEESKKFYKNILPAVLGCSVTQINIWIGTIIATTIPGAVSLIYYCDRLVQLPISLIGVSIGIVILPALSRYFKKKEIDNAISTQNRAIEFSLILSLPCMVAVFALSEPIIRILFERGEFTSSDTIKAIPGLITLSIGLPAYIINKIIVPSFFAVQDTKTPVKISVTCLIINVVGNLILIRFIGYYGITLVTALTGWLNFSLLIFFAYKKGIFKFDSIIKVKFLRILLSSIFLYLFLDAISGLSRNFLNSDKSLVSISSFAGIIISGLILYLYALRITGAYSFSDLKNIS
jgi:putative peptidoglycan lipid II flippase